MHAHLRKARWQQGFRRNHSNLRRPKRCKRMNGRAGHTRVQHVAHDGHTQLMKVALVMPNGEHVEKRLSGMGMPAIAGIHDVNLRCHLVDVSGN